MLKISAINFSDKIAASALVSLSKKIIKPFSPTPFSERIYKLSFIDQFNTTQYIPIAFFYPNTKGGVASIEPNDMCNVIENSLSKALAAYYPFAGTLRDNVHIECNDIGADFYKARFDCPMSEIFKSHDRNVKEIVDPKDVLWNVVAPNRKLVMVQFNQFDCGGIALSACVSNKTGDIWTLNKFTNDWADSNLNIHPQFIGSSIFPPKNKPVHEPPHEQCVTNRLTFSNHTLRSLLSASSSSGEKKPSRVEILTALLYKCGMRANSSRLFKPPILFQTVNLRPLIPLPLDTPGNFSSSFFVRIYVEEEMRLSRLVSELRKGKEQFFDNYKKCKGVPQDLISTTMGPFQEIRALFKGTDFDLYRCSSLVNYPLYDVDFGWGRPNKISMADAPLRNTFRLFDNNTTDHVVAQVSFDEESTMSAFLREMDQLLEFELPSDQEIQMETRC